MCFQYLTLGRKVASVMQKLIGYRRFLGLISSSDIPGLRRLVSQALHDGCGVSAIVRKVEAALEHAYSAKGSSGADIDIALMRLRLGGRRSLFAVRRHFGLPSLRTTLRSCTLSSPKLARSIAFPTYEASLS